MGADRLGSREAVVEIAADWEEELNNAFGLSPDRMGDLGERLLQQEV